MQEDNNTVNSQPTFTSSVASPVSGSSKKGANKWLFIFLGLLVLGALGVYLFTRSAGNATPSPTPSFGVVPIDNEVSNATPSPTPAPVDKKDIKIEIQNGTGIAGEAAFLQAKLKALGYSDITAKNADKTDYTDTIVTFSKDTPTSVSDEIKKELEGLYKKVVVKTSSTQKTNVVIITGLRAGATTKPTTKATSTPKTSASATPTSSATPTPTPASGN